jgi:hypothetical protein
LEGIQEQENVDAFAMQDAVITVAGRQVYKSEARMKWWHIISEHKVELLQRLRSDKEFRGPKISKAKVHEEVAALMTKSIGEHTISFKMTGAQSKGLYATLKAAHDKYVSNPSGSAGGAPPPDMFTGFWTSYNQSFSQCLNLSPVFRADPVETRIGADMQAWLIALWVTRIMKREMMRMPKALML